MNATEYFVACHWHDTFVFAVADHGITLSTASLAVRKQTAVVPFPSVVEDLLSKFVIDILLVCILAM